MYRPPLAEAHQPVFELVAGTPEARETLLQTVTAEVTAVSSPQDRFAVLKKGFTAAFLDAISISEAAFAEHISENAEFGMTVTGEVLEAIGVAYARKSYVPQQEEVVRSSTHRLLAHVHSLAFLDRKRAGKELEAFRLGISPRSIFMSPVSFIGNFLDGGGVPRKVHQRGLKVTRDADRQIHIAPRRKRVSRPGVARCPATHARVLIDGAPRGALFETMKLAGDVAISSIYPSLFEIATD